MNQLENHALVCDVINELVEHSTIYKSRVHISPLEARTMTLEVLHNECKTLLEDLKGYPNIVVLQEYVKRMGYFVETHDAT